MKVFLSHPMSDLSKEEVLELRKNAEEGLKMLYHDDFEIINNYEHENVPDDPNPLWNLGASIQQMGDADLIVFLKNSDKSRGCQIEKEIVKKYGLEDKVLNIEVF